MWTTGGHRQIPPPLTLLTAASDGRQRWKTKSGFTILPPGGGGRSDLSHHPDSGAGIDSLRSPQMFSRRARCRGVQSVHSLVAPAAEAEAARAAGAEMWLPSGSLVPTYSQSIPTLLHGSTRGKFSSAGCSLIQVGGEAAPPWTGDGLW